jgi:hypothetical protein
MRWEGGRTTGTLRTAEKDPMALKTKYGSALVLILAFGIFSGLLGPQPCASCVHDVDPVQDGNCSPFAQIGLALSDLFSLPRVGSLPLNNVSYAAGGFISRPFKPPEFPT